MCYNNDFSASIKKQDLILETLQCLMYATHVRFSCTKIVNKTSLPLSDLLRQPRWTLYLKIFLFVTSHSCPLCDGGKKSEKQVKLVNKMCGLINIENLWRVVADCSNVVNVVASVWMCNELKMQKMCST